MTSYFHPVYRATGRTLSLALAGALLLLGGCKRSPQGEQGKNEPRVSAIIVLSDPGAPIAIRAPGAEYDVLPTGYVVAYQVVHGRPITVEDPERGSLSFGDTLTADGKVVRDFVLDFGSLKTTDVNNKIGKLGKHVDLIARSKSTQIEKTLTLEAYDDFPGVAIETLTYRNLADKAMRIDRLTSQRHRLDASTDELKLERYQFWYFSGQNPWWSKDHILQISNGFSQPNLMGPHALARGETPSPGEATPVVAFWTLSHGFAVGHLELTPQAVGFPVRTLSDGRVEVYMEVAPAMRLAPGEAYTAPRSFVSIFAGDYFEALANYGRILERAGQPPAKFTRGDFSASWNGPGIGFTALQLRRRNKMYKALFGPQAVVFSDPVELARGAKRDASFQEMDLELASAVGTGGVIGKRPAGTDGGSKQVDSSLTPQKEALWKKWIEISNQKGLSRGTFQNLYFIGNDLPSGFAIEKDDKMYYAFFSPQPDKPWKGEVELRGLKRKIKYRVYDYLNQKELGTVESPILKLTVEFTGYLLLEVSQKQ